MAIIANAGNANACTGEPMGLRMPERTADLVGQYPEHIPPDNVLVASTGVIGQRLNMDKISNGHSQIEGSLDA